MMAMDYRQYDNALGRFNSIDVLSELAFSITPYRFAYNNPIYFSDPTGLFETRKEARAYRREHNITGSIVKNSDGGYSINDKANATSYFRPQDGIEVSTMGSDGVATSALASERNTSSGFPTIKEGFTLWGNNLFGDLGGYKNGIRAHSIQTDNIPIMGDKARSVRGSNPFEKLFNALKNAWDLWTKVENIQNVAKNGNTIPGTIETQNTEPVKISVPLYHYSIDNTGGNKPTVEAHGYHDTLVNPSEKNNINSINNRNLERNQQKADALAAQKGY